MPQSSPAIPRRPLVIAAAVSFFLLLAIAWIRGGVASTSYDTRDSQGRTMGFNDTFSAEHYGILLRNGSPGAAAAQMNSHDWALVAAHIVVLILITRAQPRHLKRLLWIQPVLFFWGVPALYWMPLELSGLLYFHGNTRESFVDIPYISIMSQGAWLWACIFMLWKLRAPRHGALTAAPRTRAAAA